MALYDKFAVYLKATFGIKSKKVSNECLSRRIEKYFDEHILYPNVEHNWNREENISKRIKMSEPENTITKNTFIHT